MEMRSTITLQFLCLWLLWGQVLCQDIEPEFPEDFTTTTLEPAVEPAAAQTTERDSAEAAATEADTTEADTTEAATTEAVATSTSKPDTSTSTSNWRPTYPPASRPPLPWFESPEESSEDPICYLKDHRETFYNYYWSCGVPILSSLTSCYRCCYYKYNGFSGCNKLHSGRCESFNFNWEFD